jgi:YD repeat-containing protein
MLADAGGATTDTTKKDPKAVDAQTAQASANLLADAVTQKDHAAGTDGGAANAYTLLKTGVDQYAQDKTHTTEDVKKYWETLSAKLTQNGVLPELALITGKQNLTESDLLKDDKPAVPVRSLDDETLNKTADELHKAIHNTSGAAFWEHDDPDKDKISQLLEPLGQEDRKRLEEIYHDKFDSKGGADTLRHELKDKLGGDNGVDWRRAEADLNRTDGKTNDAGALMVAITESRGDKDKGNAEIRGVLETLNSEQIANLDADFRKAYGISYQDALKKANLSDATKDALPILEKGVDNKTKDDIIKLANIAVDRGDKHLFGEALRGDTADNAAARQQLMNDETFKNKLAEKFKSQGYEDGDVDKKAKFEQKVDRVALDYLTEGRISLATITSEDTGKWIFNNDDNVSLAAKNASQDERDQYARGRDAASKDPKQQSDQEKTDAAFYNKIHKAFKNGGSDKQVAIWEDELTHGKDTLITSVAKTHDDGWGPLNFGSGTNMNDAMTRVEQMNEEDFKNLQDPKYYAQFKDSLRKYSDDGEYNRIMGLVDQKLVDDKGNKRDFLGSQTVHRSLSEVVDDNKSHAFLCFGTSYNGKNILDNIENLSQDDAKKYQSDANFRKDVDSLINGNLSDEEKMLAHRLLDQSAKTGDPPKLAGDDEAKFLHDKIHGADAQTLIADGQAMLEKNPDLRQRLTGSIQDLKGDDLILKGDIEDALTESYYKSQPMPPDGSYGLDNPTADQKLQSISDDLFKNGSLTLQSKLDLNFSKVDLIGEIAKAPEAERSQLRGQLNEQERQVLDAAVSNPNQELSTADKMRLFIIGDGGNYSDFQGELDTLHKTNDFNAIQNLKDEYSRKYHGDIDNDFLNKVSSSDKNLYKNLLTPENGDGRQTFYDNLKKQLDENGLSVDGTSSTMQKSIDQNANALEEYQKIYKTLPPDAQQALDKYFNDSLEQYKQSKDKLAEIVVDAAITAAAVTAVIASGGTLAPAAIALLATGAAAFRVGAQKIVEGNDFDSSPQNLIKQGVIGFTSFALNCVGPEMFAAEGPLLSSALEGTLTTIGAKTALKEGGETALQDLLKQGFTKGALDDGAVSKFASSYLENPAEVDAFKANLQGSFDASNKALTTQMQELAQQQAAQWAEKSTGEKLVIRGGELVREVGTNAGIGAGANVTSELVVAPFSPDGLNPDRLLESAFSGAAAGAGMTLLLKPIGFGAGRLAERFGDHAMVGDGANSGIPMNVTKGEDGHLYYDPKNNLPGYEITRQDGSVVKVEGDQPIRFENGDQLTKAPDNVKIEDHDGQTVITDGVHDAPVTTAARMNDDAPATMFGDEKKGWFGRLKDAVSDAWKGIWDKKPVAPTFKGQDDVAISLNGREYNLGPDGKLQIGRGLDSSLSHDGYVSGNHGTLEYKDNKFYYTDTSTNGSYIQRNGQWERLPKDQPVEINPLDEVRLGGVNGPPLDLFPKSGPVDRTVSLNGVDLQPGADGSIPIGRDQAGLQDGANDILSMRVSRDHGDLRFDGNTQQYIFTDHHSGNGTYIERADGSWTQIQDGKIYTRAKDAPPDQWVYQQDNNSAYVKDGDKIHLASENGPAVIVAEQRGRLLQDGSTQYHRPEGDYIYKLDGDSVFKNHSGEQTFRDKAGNVLRTESPTGKNIEFKYDNNGNLTATKISNGQSWEGYQTTDGGKTWFHDTADAAAPNGYRTERFDGKVEVNGDGSVRTIPNDARQPIEIKRVDGSTEKMYSNGFHEYEPADFNTERANLRAVADYTFGDAAQRDRFLQFSSEFEARAAREGIPQEKVAGVYQQVERLMQGGNDAALNEADRARLAEQMMYNAAHPETIDQGANNTCNVTTIEMRMFARDPEAAARVITDVALNGKYVTPEGKVVDVGRVGGLEYRPDPGKPDIMSNGFDRGSSTGVKYPADVKADGYRNWADEIFQNTAVNLNYSDATTYITQEGGNWVRKPVPEGGVVQYSNRPGEGERLVLYGPDGRYLKTTEIGQGPNVAADDLGDIYNKLVPSHAPDGYIANGVDDGFVIAGRPGRSGMVVPQSDSDLFKKLSEMGQNGKLPAIAWVDTDKSPTLFGAPQGDHGSHVVTITDVDPKTGMVKVVNQWGEVNNKWISVQELYGALYR